MTSLFIITGPTASGKSALALEVARQNRGEIVSADSMQIYRGMDIGTAKPTRQDCTTVPHHMLDIVDPCENYSVSRYSDEAAAAVYDIISRGKTPIICGGTGQYIDALVNGTGFLPKGDDALRASLEAEWQRQGAEAMMEQLRQIDPQSASTLHINNKKRILRAIEVFTLTGKTIARHNEETQSRPPRFNQVTVALSFKNRQTLYNRIDSRVDQMFDMGLLEEADGLFKAGALGQTAMQAIGYKELFEYFQGGCSLENAKDKIKQRSRNYAKRQLTWIRAKKGVNWRHPDETPMDEIIRQSTKFLHESL